MDEQEKLTKAAMVAIGADDDDDSNDCIQSPALKECLNATMAFVFFIFLGTVYFMIANGEYYDAISKAGNGAKFTNAFYMATMTVTTVGYGDFSPQGEGNRIFACFYMLAGVLAVARALGSLIGTFLLPCPSHPSLLRAHLHVRP